MITVMMAILTEQNAIKDPHGNPQTYDENGMLQHVHAAASAERISVGSKRRTCRTKTALFVSSRNVEPVMETASS